MTLPSLHHLSQTTSLAVQSFDPNRGKDGPLTDPEKAWGLIGNLASLLIGLAIFAAAVTAFAYIVIGAIRWGTATSPEAVAQARKTMLYAVAGFIMVCSVYLFIQLINIIGS